ncbi:MAG: SNF2-related protein [Planctomycetes bacterium]|nr:SNF2-related protein [Planctomycetota bacterium]
MLPPGSLVAVPDLPWEGPARLLVSKGNTVVIRFLATGAEMTQPEKSVSRYLLLPGTRVAVESPEGRRDALVAPRQVLRDAKTGMLVYLVTAADGQGPETRLREDGIALVPPPRDPAEQLATVAFHDLRPGSDEPWGPLVFDARERLLSWRDGAWKRTRGVVSLAGARVVPMPHQLITARTCLADRQIRFLLADEVGLGKTIEAGLVVQSLLAMKPTLRVLVVAPGALVSQWFLELYVKFGGRRFLMLDHERLGRLPGNPWKDEQFVIASSRAIEEMDPKQGLRLAQSQWDVLIVDECHRMQPGGVLYKRIAVLSKNSPHVLLLSATPGRSHPEAWLGLLALLQPQVHRLDDLEAFKRRLDVHAEIARLLERTIAADDAGPLGREWAALVPGDAALARLAAALPRGGGAARDALVAHVRAHYRLEHRVVRQRRQVLARLSRESKVNGLAVAERTGERVPYKPDAPEQAVLKALTTYRGKLVKAHGDTLPPRLMHWLLQLELAAACHPAVLERLLAMRQTIVADPDGYEDYRKRAQKGESLAAVLRSDLSEAEASSHVAVSAACHVDPALEEAALDAAHAAALAWDKAATRKGTARIQALIARLAAFWNDRPREKVLVFTLHGLAVIPLHDCLTAAFPGTTVETFGAHQDTVAREEAVRRFRDDDRCALMVCDPLGGEGRNFQFVSAIAHHDLPWSVAAVEQRIGRVDRLGRDGEVPSWVVASQDAKAIDGAWADLLDQAVGVFQKPASGLEFAADAFEGRALAAALAGGGEGLRADQTGLAALVSDERQSVEAQEDAAFHEDSSAFAAAAADAAAVAGEHAPVDAVLRWLRALGGSAKRLDDHPRPFQIRTRWHDHPETGTFERDTALAHPELAFLALGNDTVDRLLADAQASVWCRATAVRRKPTDQVAKWEGIRATLELVPDLAPLVAAGLPLESLRRLFLAAPPRREVVAVRIADGTAAVERDPAVLALVLAPVDGRTGDSTLSQSGSRDLWSRLALGGKLDQVVGWQDGIRKACAAAEAEAQSLLDALRDAAAAALAAASAEAQAQVRAIADATVLRLGADDPASKAAEREAALEKTLGDALAAALAGARLELASVAYVHVG